MDLNELLHEHQVAVMHASAAGDGATRQNHFDKVAIYARRIRDLRDFRQRADAPGGSDQRATIIYGTYAGDPLPEESSSAMKRWENEGGAFEPSEPALPADVSLAFVPQYRVGPYVYSDLARALAENERQVVAKRSGAQT